MEQWAVGFGLIVPGKNVTSPRVEHDPMGGPFFFFLFNSPHDPGLSLATPPTTLLLRNTYTGQISQWCLRDTQVGIRTITYFVLLRLQNSAGSLSACWSDTVQVVPLGDWFELSFTLRGLGSRFPKRENEYSRACSRHARMLYDTAKSRLILDPINRPHRLSY